MTASVLLFLFSRDKWSGSFPTHKQGGNVGDMIVTMPKFSQLHTYRDIEYTIILYL